MWELTKLFLLFLLRKRYRAYVATLLVIRLEEYVLAEHHEEVIEYYKTTQFLRKFKDGDKIPPSV